MNNEQATNQLSKKEYQTYFEKGIGYDTYMLNFIAENESKIETKNSHYLPINLQRTKRITKTIQLSDEIKTVLNTIQQNLNWLVISEHWCGDAAQIVPVINAVVNASNGKINLKIVYRDDNLQLMNAHLTKGAMSIPMLIQLDTDFNVIGTYGPRPNEAQLLVETLKANPETAADYKEKLHKWYATDKSVSTQNNLLKLLKKSLHTK